VLAASLALTSLSPTTPYGQLIAAYLVFGAGFGLLNPPITNTAVSGMPPAQAGVAAAVASTSRQVGQTLGVALVGAIAVPAGALAPADLAPASHAGWWLVAGLGAVIALIGLLSTTPRALLTAVRTAQALQDEPAPA
jgi:hypothetical protein